MLSLSAISIWYTANTSEVINCNNVKSQFLRYLNLFLCQSLIVPFPSRSQRHSRSSNILNNMERFMFHYWQLALRGFRSQIQQCLLLQSNVSEGLKAAGVENVWFSGSTYSALIRWDWISDFCKTWCREREQYWLISLRAKLPSIRRWKKLHIIIIINYIHIRSVFSFLAILLIYSLTINVRLDVSIANTVSCYCCYCK